MNILNILKSGESETIEFKSSFGKEVIITLSALANTKGGKVIVGVDNNGRPTGIEFGPETEQRYLNEIKVATYPQIIPHITLLDIQGKNVLVFEINEYPIKPIAYKNRYYKRVRNSNHMLSLEEIVDLQQQSLNISYDAYPLNESLKSLDRSHMEMFIKTANATGRVNLRDDLLTNFTKMKLIQNGKPTLAALLLFGNHGYSIHIGRFRAADTIIDDLLLKAPLITALDEAMVFIKKHINLSYDFDGSLQRKEHWQYPLEALRELLLNAVVHRDYKNASDIVIKIFDDRIVFTSPGRLFGNLTIADLQRDDYVSSIRNKLLAESFYLIGEIEKYGTGFVRIRQWLKDYSNVSFVLDETGDHFRVVLTHVDDMAGQVADKHRTSTGQAPGRHAILEFCRQPRSAKKIMAFSGMKHRETFMKNYLHPMIQEGLLSLTIPDKPRSPKQKYVATPAGISLSESKTK